MRDRPDAADLLEIAREVLQRSILPQLPPALRMDGLMIVNALGNAEREIAAGETPLRAELDRLAALHGVGAEAANAEALEAALDRFNRRLVADIRAGRYDDEPALERHLRATTLDRVRETNPRYLADRAIEP